MTNEQRERIAIMRKSGISSAKIASALGLSENTVKSHCKRNRLSGNAEHLADMNGKSQLFCLNCGIPIVQTAGHRVRKYCSDRCRISWWNKNPAAPNRKMTRAFTCLACGKQFDGYGSRERKYCSRSCCARFKVGRL